MISGNTILEVMALLALYSIIVVCIYFLFSHLINKSQKDGQVDSPWRRLPAEQVMPSSEFRNATRARTAHPQRSRHGVNTRQPSNIPPPPPLQEQHDVVHHLNKNPRFRPSVCPAWLTEMNQRSAGLPLGEQNHPSAKPPKPQSRRALARKKHEERMHKARKIDAERMHARETGDKKATKGFDWTPPNEGA